MTEKKVTYEQVRDMLEEGEQWVPFLKDGIAHGDTHTVLVPPVNVSEEVGRFLRDLMAGGRLYARDIYKRGAIVRVNHEGKRYRVMVTEEGEQDG